jgi:hypothetical protein
VEAKEAVEGVGFRFEGRRKKLFAPPVGLGSSLVKPRPNMPVGELVASSVVARVRGIGGAPLFEWCRLIDCEPDERESRLLSVSSRNSE